MWSLTYVSRNFYAAGRRDQKCTTLLLLVGETFQKRSMNRRGRPPKLKPWENISSGHQLGNYFSISKKSTNEIEDTVIRKQSKVLVDEITEGRIIIFNIIISNI